jgi:hypothetical protein
MSSSSSSSFIQSTPQRLFFTNQRFPAAISTMACEKNHRDKIALTRFMFKIMVLFSQNTAESLMNGKILC